MTGTNRWAAFLVATVLVGSSVLHGSEPRWQQLPLPEHVPLPNGSIPKGPVHVHGLGIEASGDTWMMAGYRLYRYDGRSWVGPIEQIHTGRYLDTFVGGGQRGLYLTQHGDRDHLGRIYRLSDGQAHKVTSFRYDREIDKPGVYVSTEGRLYNWTSNTVAMFDGAEWYEWPARLEQRYTFVCETPGQVHFFFNGYLYTITGTRLEERIFAESYLTDVGRTRVHSAKWGDDRLVTLQYGQRGVKVFDLKKREMGDAGPISAAVGDRRCYDLFSDRQGNVWIMVHDPEAAGYVLCRITPDGEGVDVPSTTPLQWSPPQFWQYPKNVLQTHDGRIVFALRKSGVVEYEDGVIHPLAQQPDLAGEMIRELHEDSPGRLYAVSHEGVWRLENDSVTKQGKADASIGNRGRRIPGCGLGSIRLRQRRFELGQ